MVLITCCESITSPNTLVVLTRFRMFCSLKFYLNLFISKVMSVEIVTEDGGINAPNFSLSQQMQKCFGIAAVGTEKGHVYLLDLRVDENDTSNEEQARDCKVVSMETPHLENLRLRLSQRREHLCLELNCEYYQVMEDSRLNCELL